MTSIIIAILLYLVGFLLAFVGFVWVTVQAFKEDTVWGVLYLLVPFAPLVFYTKKWSIKKIRKTFFMQLVGWPIALFSMGVQMFYMFQTGNFMTTVETNINYSENTSGESPSPVPTDANISPSPKPPLPSAKASPRLSQTPVPAGKYDFIQSMQLGYLAYEQGDYQTALINFNRALQVRPGDAYAVKAVDNTKKAIVQAKVK